MKRFQPDAVCTGERCRLMAGFRHSQRACQALLPLLCLALVALPPPQVWAARCDDRVNFYLDDIKGWAGFETMCYEIRPGARVNETVLVDNQFGATSLEVRRARELCVPVVRRRRPQP